LAEAHLANPAVLRGLDIHSQCIARTSRGSTVRPSPSGIYSLKITGTGSYVPETVISSTELAEGLGSSAEWIHKTLGILERRRAAPNETTSDLATEAGHRALSQAGLTPEDIDLLIVTTMTPDRFVPSTAAIVQHKLGAAKPYPTFDLAAACSGFLYGLTTASQFLSTGLYQRVLLIGAETLSRFTDWSQRDCVYFGDGAAAAVLTPSRAGYGLLAMELGNDATGRNFVTVPAGGAERPASHDTVRSREHFYQHNGRDVFDFALDRIPPIVQKVLDRAGLIIGDLKAVISHQPSLHMLHALSDQLQIPFSKMTTILDRFGNTGAASMPMALDDYCRSRQLKEGDHVLFIGFGAGMSWGVALLRWEE
jgi:3-oxoacyl-[acyl-carrier-protein] synthase-3